MKDLFITWIRQSTTILGLSMAAGTTVALATKQITLDAAIALYVTAGGLLVGQQHPPARLVVQDADKVAITANPNPPNVKKEAP